MTAPDPGRWELPPLTAADRCDQGCGAAALVKVVTDHGDLLFCGHHYTKGGAALQNVARHVHDERRAHGYNVDTRQEIDPLGRMCEPTGAAFARQMPVVRRPARNAQGETTR
jgi:hypothetical protein